MSLLGWLRRSDPLLFVVLALFAAAVLVVHLQHQALLDGQRQRGVILRTMAEHHAEAAAREIQRTLEAPLFDTLSAVNHPLLRAGRHDLVAARYADGLQEYPQVDRFFLWIDSDDSGARGDILFFDRSSSERPSTGHLPRGFYRDTLMSSAIRSLAEEHAGAQRIYLASERTVAGRTYDIVVRLFWVDAGREEYFALLGFVVDHEAARSRMFEELYALRLGRLLAAGTGGPAFALQVLDQDHRVAFGAGDADHGLSARAEFPLRFYPRDVIEGRLASETPVRTWQVQVAPVPEARHPLFASVTADGYWRSAGPVLLIVIALGLMVQSRRRAAELARMQSTFISHVSHQLKTPLSLLSAAAESLVLNRVRTPDKRAQYLAIMRSETARLSLLVERVLEFSKLEQGRRSYEFEVTDLVRLVHETAEAFRPTLADKGFLFTLETPEAPLWVRADPAAFEQVLVNLLDNAVKYSKEHRAITIRVGDAGGDAYFEVADRGIGIRATDIDRIFERFYRGTNASSDCRGFGVGLAIADEIVRAHRGRIDVSGEPGQGTRFRVSLARLRDQREGATGRPGAAHFERFREPLGGRQST
jgi:signal transduction histidine kinase